MQNLNASQCFALSMMYKQTNAKAIAVLRSHHEIYAVQKIALDETANLHLLL